jgi:ABC-type multidrug transport system ATPase subunit
VHDGSSTLDPEPCALLPRDEKGSFRRMSAYVQQDDVMYPYQTVKETLSMASKLRLPNGEGQDEEYRESFVGSLVEQLGLVKATDTVIGDEKVICARFLHTRE